MNIGEYSSRGIFTNIHEPEAKNCFSMIAQVIEIPKRRNLTNRTWLSVVCTLIDNDTRHHSGQNVVDSRGAAE